MPRRKGKCKEEKSTVMKIRDDFDWGRILYDACHVFNRGFANYLVEYARNYDDGKVTVLDVEKETQALVEKRDRLIGEREVLHDAVRKASVNKVEAFRKYAKALPIGEAVSQWRNGSDSSGMYDGIIQERISLWDAYCECVKREKEALEAERRHIDANLFATRALNHRMKNIVKMMDKHGLPLGHRMADDVQAIYDLITSDNQTERLMAVCLNILNTYSEREFSTMMDVFDREHIVEKIYDFFSKFEHNYDFISGCYDIDEENHRLRLKPLDVLASKIYNGYYFTIRGYVQRSYASIRFEKFNVESVDIDWGSDNDNGNHGIDKKVSSENECEIGNQMVTHDPEPLDDGMMDVWTDCNHFLSDNIGRMSEEVADQLSRRFPRNPYYHSNDTLQRTRDVMAFVVSNVNGELTVGNVIGSKLKHIVLDSMGGAETNEEWKQNVVIISKTMEKYIRMFFSLDRNAYDDDFMRCVEDD